VGGVGFFGLDELGQVLGTQGFQGRTFLQVEDHVEVCDSLGGRLDARALLAGGRTRALGRPSKQALALKKKEAQTVASAPPLVTSQSLFYARYQVWS